MRVLFLGGTRFVGLHAVNSFKAAGHDVTLFHRGSRGKLDLPGVDEVLGDRKENLDLVATDRWDLVVDTCGYTTTEVRLATEALEPNCDRYLFVSTISVFDPTVDGLKRHQPFTGDDETVTGETYGPLKVSCEDLLQSAFGDRLSIVRPCIVAGPNDPTYRNTYWMRRASQGGPFLCPDRLDQPVQRIDARDLGDFMVQVAENADPVPYETAAPSSTFGEFLSILTQMFPQSQPVPISEADRTKHGIEDGKDLPLLAGPESPTWNLFRIDPSPAIKAGLKIRPFEETVRDTLKWVESLEEYDDKKLSRERELEVLNELEVSG